MVAWSQQRASVVWVFGRFESVFIMVHGREHRADSSGSRIGQANGESRGAEEENAGRGTAVVVVVVGGGTAVVVVVVGGGTAVVVVVVGGGTAVVVVRSSWAEWRVGR
jgi:hypothetical protein